MDMKPNRKTPVKRKQRIKCLSEFNGLTSTEMNCFLQHGFGLDDVRGAEAFHKVTNSGETILVLKDGATNLSVSKGSFRRQKGYNLASETYFCKRKFEKALNDADIVLIPVSIKYTHRVRTRDIPSTLKGHHNHEMLIIYIKKEKKYLLVDSLKLSSKSKKRYPLLHRIQVNIINFFRGLGLKGVSSTHDFHQSVPIINGCCLSVLWSIKKIIDDPKSKPEKTYGSYRDFLVFARSVVDTLDGHGYDVYETSKKYK